jgi:AcrR family transcriptional regulator
MGSRERRQRHRARVRQAILVAARELFVAEGVRNVSLRQIAARIEYSPAVFYTYFRCKEDIFLALAEEDAAVLHRVYEATRRVVDPLERVRRALWALYEFLNANPVFVELIILDNSGPRMKAGRQRLACFHEVAAGVEADIRTCIERGQMSMAPRPQPASCCGSECSARRQSRGGLHVTRNARCWLTTCSRHYSPDCRHRVSAANPIWNPPYRKPAHDDHARSVSKHVRYGGRRTVCWRGRRRSNSCAAACSARASGAAKCSRRGSSVNRAKPPHSAPFTLSTSTTSVLRKKADFYLCDGAMEDRTVADVVRARRRPRPHDSRLTSLNAG